MAENGLRRGRNNLEIYGMCENPWSVILAKAFAERVESFFIGSKDLAQLALDVDS
jgi:pyruvate, water dikinase